MTTVNQPVGSYVRFGTDTGQVGGHPVFWEYKNGKPRKPTVRFTISLTQRDYYQAGDFFDAGESAVHELKRVFPDAGFHSDKLDFWDLVSSLLGNHTETKYRLVNHIDSITLDANDPWRGQVHTSYYIIVEKRLVPMSGRNAQQMLDARQGAGELNTRIGIAPSLQQMQFLQTMIEGEVKIIHELAIDATLGALGKSFKGLKIVQKIAEAKHVVRAARILDKLNHIIDSKVLLKACMAFAKEFTSTLASDLKAYTLHQLAGKEEKIALGAKQTTTAMTFDTMTITPTKATTTGNAYTTLGTLPTIDVNKALIHGAAAFAHSILVVDGLAAPIAKAVAKKMIGKDVGKEMAVAVGNFVKGHLSGLGKDFFTGAIATAANAALKDPKGKSSYPDHLVQTLKDKLLSHMTSDFIKGVLHAAAFGMG